MVSIRFHVAVLFAAMVAVLGGCGERPPVRSSTDERAVTNARQFFVKGVVRELKPNGRTALIEHEEIPNYMAAMTMPLDVKNPQELAGLKPGDPIFFRMLVTSNDAWIDQITKTGATITNVNELPRSFRRVRDVDPLNVGDPLPDYAFTNELGQAVSFGQFKGRALAFTFIFTRCPYPLFCPRMAQHFAEAARRMSARPGGATNWHLLSITFDVDNDTPAVLKNYAQTQQYDPHHWSFLTGALIDIDALTEQFGLVFARSGGGIGIFDHNLRTVVVDARGRIQTILIGNEWKVDELVAELEKAAAAAPK